MIPHHFPAAKAQLSLSPASCLLQRARARAEDGVGDRNHSQCLAGAVVGQCEVGMTPDIPQVSFYLRAQELGWEVRNNTNCREDGAAACTVESGGF